MTYRHNVSDWLAHPRSEARHTIGQFFASLHNDRWMAYALCGQADPEAWFPERGHHTSETKAALRLCRTCPVRTDCLDYALNYPTELSGIWGGTTTRQRRALRQERDTA